MRPDSISRPKRVLIIDRDEQILMSLERLFEEAGFSTATCWTATDAIRFMRSAPYDVVLADEYLPDLSCEDLLLRRHKHDSTHWIVLQSAAPSMTGKTRFTSLGAVAVVCKHDTLAILSLVKQVTSTGELPTRTNVA